MTIRDLIKELLNHNLSGNVTIQYPNREIDKNNYCGWKEEKEFQIVECSEGIIFGVIDED